MALLINTEKLQFLKAADTTEQLEYWAEILCPDDNFIIVDTHKRVYSIFTEMELKVLYGNTIMQDLRHVVPESYSKLLQETAKLGQSIPKDDTSVEELKRTLGRPLKPVNPMPAKEKGRTPPKKRAPQANGSKPAGGRPKPGSTTAKVWDIADEVKANCRTLDIHSKELRNRIVEECTEQGINPSTAATQFGKWKKDQINS